MIVSTATYVCIYYTTVPPSACSISDTAADASAAGCGTDDDTAAALHSNVHLEL
jgi:hypothetical protein